MALYILVLHAVPCSDIHNSCNKKNETAKIEQNHHQHQDKVDSCSPFCLCSCCSTAALVKDFMPFVFEKHNQFSFSLKINIREFSFISNYFGSIWLPPKISAIY